MKHPCHGDRIYIDDPKLSEYGQRGTIVDSVTIDVCPYNWYLLYTVRCLGSRVEVNMDQISTSKPGPRKERLSSDLRAANDRELNCLNQELKSLNKRRVEIAAQIKELTK